MKRIPIAAARRIVERLAKEFAGQYDVSQVAIVSWDGETRTTWVTTYGKSLKDSEQAAMLGNRIKRDVLQWPASMCLDVPARVRRARARKA